MEIKKFFPTEVYVKLLEEAEKVEENGYGKGNIPDMLSDPDFYEIVEAFIRTDSIDEWWNPNNGTIIMIKKNGEPVTAKKTSELIGKLTSNIK